MSPKECADTWKEIVKTYREDTSNHPDVTAEAIVQKAGMDAALETLAAVVRIRCHDGRISPQNREALSGIPVHPDAAVYKSENPLIRAGLDDIHMAHVNQMISALLRLRDRDEEREIG